MSKRDHHALIHRLRDRSAADRSSHSQPTGLHDIARLIALLCLLVLAGCAVAQTLPEPLDETPEATAKVVSTRRATPVATSAGPPAPTAIVPPAGVVPRRTLAFVSDRGGTIDLWMTDIITGQLWRLTNDRAIESFPTWSPDGTLLAYVVEDEHAVRNLWLLDLRTGKHRQLTNAAPPFDVRRAAWLRGSRVLIYDTGKPFDRRPELRTVTVDGVTLAPLQPDEGSVIWDWSTNGETIVCAVGPQLGEPRIVVTDAAPGAQLLPEANSPVGFAVELSPDGHSVVYSAPPLSDDQTTWVLNVATMETWAINDVRDIQGTQVPGRRFEHDFAWLPDSQRLIFVHGVGGVTDGQGRLKVGDAPPPISDGYAGLWLTNSARQPQNRQRIWLTIGNADASPRPSPDGRWIAFLTDAQIPSAARSDIWVVPLPGSNDTPINLTYGNGNNWAPAWMPLYRPGGNGR